MGDDETSAPMRRVLVSGISGAGKSTLARQVAAACSLPYTELDALHHGPGWVKRPEFEADAAALAAGERWITEDQYQTFIGDLLWQRADTVLWLDLPRRVVMWRVVTRTTRVLDNISNARWCLSVKSANSASIMNTWKSDGRLRTTDCPSEMRAPDSCTTTRPRARLPTVWPDFHSETTV